MNKLKLQLFSALVLKNLYAIFENPPQIKMIKLYITTESCLVILVCFGMLVEPHWPDQLFCFSK